MSIGTDTKSRRESEITLGWMLEHPVMRSVVLRRLEESFWDTVRELAAELNESYEMRGEIRLSFLELRAIVRELKLLSPAAKKRVLETVN